MNCGPIKSNADKNVSIFKRYSQYSAVFFSEAMQNEQNSIADQCSLHY